MRRSLLVIALLVLTAAVYAVNDTPLPQAVVNLPAGVNPGQITGLPALLSENGGRLTGPGPWTPPTGDPSKITKADYLEALQPDLTDMIQNYKYGQEPIEPRPLACEAMPVFAAFYQATHEQKYLTLMVNTYKAFCAAVEQEVKAGQAEMAKDLVNHRPGIGRYWTYTYVYVVIPLESIKGTPEYDQIRPMLGRALAARAEAYPLYWEAGPMNRSMAAAFWYDLALKYNPDPPTPKAAQLKAYADEVWNSWWQYRDVEEDDPDYTCIDVSVADAWGIIRGANPWEDQDARNLCVFYPLARIIHEAQERESGETEK